MKANLVRRLMTAVAVAGLTVAGLGVTSASAAPVPTIATVFNLSGTYTDGGINRPVVTANANDTLRVTLSGRPTATGVVVNADTIVVTFPDDATYGAKLIAPGTILWSNGATWTKLTIRVPNVNNLELGPARDAIRAAGLTVGATTFRVDRTCNHDDTVISTSPSAGTFVAAGQVVGITVGVLPDGPCP